MTNYTPSQVIDANSSKHSYLIAITGGVGGGAWQLKVCTLGPDHFSSGIQDYVPYVIAVEDFVKDDQGFTRGLFSLRVNQPYAITASGSPRYGSLFEAMQAHQFAGAAVTVSSYTVSAGGTQTESTLAGKIVQISDVSPQSVSFHVEQRRTFVEKLVPQRVLERTIFDTDAKKKRIPPQGDGNPFPAPLGKFRTHVPSWMNVLDGEVHNKINAAGIRPVAVSCMEIQREADERKLIYAESIPGGLRVGTSSAETYPHDAFVYHPSHDGYSRFWEDLPNGHLNYGRYNGIYDSKGYAIQINHAPYLQRPVMAVATDTDSSVGLTDGEFAVDGKIETYAVLEYNADTKTGGVWVLPTVDKLGRLSQNTNYPTYNPLQDYEGPDAPPGIIVYALISVPSGFTRPSGGQVRLGLIYPDSDEWMFDGYSETTKSFGPAEMSVGSVYLLKANQPVASPTGEVGTLDSGWAGTKFEDWAFSGTVVQDSPDRPLWNQGTSSGARPENVRIRLVNNTGNAVNLAVHAVGLQVGFRQHWAVNGSIDPNALPTKTFGQQKHTIKLGPDIVRVDRSARGNLHNRVNRTPPPPSYIDHVYMSTMTMIDSLTGTYTGTASKLLENPADWIHSRIGTYAGATGRTSGYGSFIDARNMLDDWYQYSGSTGSSDTWTGQVHEPSERQELELEIDDIIGDLPLDVVRDNAGIWTAHVWIPDSSKWPTASHYRQTSVIDPLEEMLPGREGIAFSVRPTDIEGIVNEVTVNYAYDKGSRQYTRTAKCDALGSDDGFGEMWGNAPGSGASPVDMCGWSQATYGLTREITLNAPGVHSPSVAEVIGLRALWQHYRTGVQATFSGRMSIQDLKVFQIFRVSNDMQTKLGIVPWWMPSGTTWEQIYWRAMRVELQENYDAQQNPQRSVYVEADWYPASVGDEIAFGFGGEIGLGDTFGLDGLEENPV